MAAPRKPDILALISNHLIITNDDSHFFFFFWQNISSVTMTNQDKIEHPDFELPTKSNEHLRHKSSDVSDRPHLSCHSSDFLRRKWISIWSLFAHTPSNP